MLGVQVPFFYFMGRKIEDEEDRTTKPLKLKRKMMEHQA